MLTGLVYAAVVVLWALVLVPQWLRRHERNSEHRSTLTFHRAMRTLERRRSIRGVSRARHDLDVEVVGARSRVHDRVSVDSEGKSAIDVHLDHGVDPFIGGEEEVHLRDARRVRARMHASASATRRRRQVQQLLIGVSVISILLTFMDVLPLLLGLMAPIATGVFWWLSRKQAAASALSASRKQRRDAMVVAAREQDSESGGVSRVSGRTESSETGTRPRPRGSRRPTRRHVEKTGAAVGTSEQLPESADLEAVDVRMLSGEEVATRRAGAATGTWESVESPLPSYVTSERAARSSRGADAGRNGDWTSERMLAQAEALRSPGADQEAELGLDAFVDNPRTAENLRSYQHRRAVNQ